ncbi:MAG: hypothetical protein ACRDRA_18090 [Pseudonocardiaceae bacterium]
MTTMVLHLLGAVLLVCLGLLLGATWTIQALQPKLRRQAEERRRLNAQWAMIRTAHRQQGECPLCERSLSEREWHCAPRIADKPARRSPPPR